MKLYGSTSSPYVRRVRVVADEVGEPIDWIDTTTDAGLAALREATPIAKVPVAVVDGRQLFDSRVIVEWLVTTRGWHGLAPPRDAWRTSNVLNAIDAALDGIVQLYYLRREGFAVDGTPYAQRRLDRTAAVFSWLGGQLAADRTSFDGGLGIAELALVTALDWMDFRSAYETDRATSLGALRARWREHPSLASTRPTE
jgi:glutathione S-transferase